MPKINILTPFVADLIAAGEVVERPASAVKELVENSIDAGARNITIEVRSGGAEYLRVTDDGCGMAAEDAGIAFLRHATSKLRDERGLEAIGTLGFRGEALAAIGSVSHVELMTRERGAATGTRLLLDGGEITDMHEAGCPEGTTIIVRGLFYNTPARLKFMKSDRAEGSACVSAAMRCALGHPEVSVRCVKDGKEEFFTPGDSRAESAVYSLLGRELASALMPLDLDDGTVKVTGFISTPGGGRGTRGAQFFFVNGRHIRSQLLQAAVEQAYRNTMLVGKYPACVIYLDLGRAAVDVNVHPAKTEVKFSDEKKVFDAVHYAALGAIGAPQTPSPQPELPPERVEVSPAKRTAWAPEYSPAEARRTAPTPGAIRSAPAHYQTRLDLPHTPQAIKYSPEARLAPLTRRESAPAAEAPSGEPVRVIGEALELYILVQRGEELIIIDKHAAHERIIFDRLKQSGAAIMSQTLLEPVTLSPGGAAADALAANLPLLESLGFGVEPYGEEAFILRAAPCGMDPAGARAAVEEIAESLVSSPGAAPDTDAALRTVACKAAIKAGRSSEPEELQRLAEAVCSGQVRCCPHGRPVAWTLSRRELDRQFKRIV